MSDKITQLTYPTTPDIGVPGMQADSERATIRTAANLARLAYTVAIATLANTQLYRLVVKFISQLQASWGVEQTVNVDYTSDGSATKAEIISNLVTNLNAASVPCTAQALHGDGPIQVYGDTPDQQFTLTTANAFLADPAVDKGEIPFGAFVCKDQNNSTKCRLPFTEADVISGGLGLAVRNMAQENLASGNAAYGLAEAVSYARDKKWFVKVEQDVADGDAAFVRFMPSGSNAQRGLWRKDRDGMAQVVNYAPGEANATPYMVTVEGRSYQYLSDASGTDAEIIAAFIALINAETAIHGVVASDGTTTLTLTAAAPGKAFTFSASANMVATLTTANALNAAPVSAKFRKAASAGGVSIVELDMQL